MIKNVWIPSKLASCLRVSQPWANPKVIQKLLSFSKRTWSTIQFFAFGRLANLANLWWFPRFFWLNSFSKQLQNTFTLLTYNRTIFCWKFFQNLSEYFPLFNCYKAYHRWVLRLWLCMCFLNVSLIETSHFCKYLFWLLIILKNDLVLLFLWACHVLFNLFEWDLRKTRDLSEHITSDCFKK